MRQWLTQCLLAGILGLMITGFPVLSKPSRPDIGTPNLQGKWVVQEEMCRLLCVFTLINDDRKNHERMRLQFEKGTWSEKASGHFVHIKDNEYQLTATGANVTFKLYQNTLMSLGGSTYQRVSLGID